MTAEDWFYAISAVFLAGTWIFWFVFSLFSMRRIERSIMAEGKPRPFAWDGIGIRVVGYAIRLVLPEGLFRTRLEMYDVDIDDVKKYANRNDYVRAAIFMFFGFVFVLLVALYVVLEFFFGWFA